MFGPDFYPTPNKVIEQMLAGEDLAGKCIMEPHGGKGNIVDFCLQFTSEVVACEINADLRQILQTKCKVIANDFLTVTSDQVSHLDYIIMNPPFSAEERHILHAYDIAPPGCKIITLANASITEQYSYREQKRIVSIIEELGQSIKLGNCFDEAERKTNVDIVLIKITKPGANYSQEFEGFFLEDDPEEEQCNGIMPYNVVRDLVNRYVAAVKLYDEQLSTGVKMNNLLSGFYGESITFSCTERGAPKLRNDFKKDLQKAGWKFIFDKMNMQKYATRGLREDINKFVEQQQNIPFTMKNIYRMLEVVVGTQSQRMDKSLLEVFDKVTQHCHDNRYGLEGWKTNSHYLLTEMFILDWMINNSYKWDLQEPYYSVRYEGNTPIIEDLQKALCYITGMNYDECTTLERFARDIKPKWGEWYSWGFFEIKGYKKGTMHFRFKSKDLWARFNQNIARIKGYPLPEFKEKTPMQKQKFKKEQAEFSW